MFRLGWQVFRDRARDVVAPDRLRRAVLVAALVAVVAAVALVGTELAFGWAHGGPIRRALIIALFAVGVGLVAFGAFPLTPPADTAWTINGRAVRAEDAVTTRWSVQRYLVRRMPEVLPADREVVLLDVALLQRGLTKRMIRGTAMLLGGLSAAAAVLILGFTANLTPVWFVLYLGTIPDGLVRLGRAERARLAAAALPSAAPDSADNRGRDPIGSKLGLPGDDLPGRDSALRTNHAPDTASPVRRDEPRPLNGRD